MSRHLSPGQVDDLLDYIGVEKRQWKSNMDSVQFCCPVHKERRPSAGLSVSLQVWNCCSCGEKGSFPFLLYKSLPDEFKTIYQAVRFIHERYQVDTSRSRDDRVRIKRYEDFFNAEPIPREVKPMHTLAPFKSGKETYQYFFDRGFDEETMEKFQIGYDSLHRTVTIPVFWEDGALAGVVGRYIYPRNKAERYKVYDFKRKELLFPIDKVDLSGGQGILVEGHFDAMRLHQWGFFNALALQTTSMTEPQMRYLWRNVDSIVLLLDNDERGQDAQRKIINRLRNHLDLFTVEYPDHGKNVCDWSRDEVAAMIGGSKPYYRKSIKRI